MTTTTGSSEAVREELGRLTKRELMREAIWYCLQALPILVGCLAAVWLCERAIIIFLPGLARTSVIEVASSLLVIGIGICAVAILFGVAAIYIARGIASGRRPIEPIQPGEPSIIIAPTWWARWLLGSIAIFTAMQLGVAVWKLGHWMQGTTMSVNDQLEITQLSWVAAFCSIQGAGGLVLIESCAYLLRDMKRWAAGSVLVWGTLSALRGLVPAIGYAMILIVFAYAMKPLFVGLGLGSPLNTTLVISSIVLSIWQGWSDVKMHWNERTSILTPPTPRSEPTRNDFWNWDIETETSMSGIAGNGYPFFMWRESADNRIGLSRPRYCCILKEEGELKLAFFNPSEDVRPTGALIVAAAISAMVAIAMITGLWVETPPPAAYISNNNPPAFLRFLSFVTASAVSGIASGSLWYFCVTLVRWYWGRFEHDGRLYVQPLHKLSGFNLVDAGELGAKVNGERAKTGRGLTAVFDDGSMWILTANAWEYASIVRYHSALTNAFREGRDQMLAELDAEKKHAARGVSRAQGNTSTAIGAELEGIPTTL